MQKLNVLIDLLQELEPSPKGTNPSLEDIIILLNNIYLDFQGFAKNQELKISPESIKNQLINLKQLLEQEAKVNEQFLKNHAQLKVAMDRLLSNDPNKLDLVNIGKNRARFIELAEVLEDEMMADAKMQPPSARPTLQKNYFTQLHDLLIRINLRLKKPIDQKLNQTYHLRMQEISHWLEPETKTLPSQQNANSNVKFNVELQKLFEKMQEILVEKHNVLFDFFDKQVQGLKQLMAEKYQIHIHLFNNFFNEMQKIIGKKDDDQMKLIYQCAQALHKEMQDMDKPFVQLVLNKLLEVQKMAERAEQVELVYKQLLLIIAKHVEPKSVPTLVSNVVTLHNTDSDNLMELYAQLLNLVQTQLINEAMSEGKLIEKKGELLQLKPLQNPGNPELVKRMTHVFAYFADLTISDQKAENLTIVFKRLSSNELVKTVYQQFITTTLGEWVENRIQWTEAKDTLTRYMRENNKNPDIPALQEKLRQLEGQNHKLSKLLSPEELAKVATFDVKDKTSLELLMMFLPDPAFQDLFEKLRMGSFIQRKEEINRIFSPQSSSQDKKTQGENKQIPISKLLEGNSIVDEEDKDFKETPIGHYIALKYKSNSPSLATQNIGAITMQNVAITQQREKKAEFFWKQVPQEQRDKLVLYDPYKMSTVEKLLLFLPESDYQNFKMKLINNLNQNAPNASHSQQPPSV